MEYETGGTITEGGEVHGFAVYLITMDKLDQYWHIMDRGASIMARLAGFDYVWDAPPEKSNELQIQVLNHAVENGADLIMLAANDPVQISSAIEDAKSKGIGIIYVDSPAYEEAIITLATDNYNAGRSAAEIMLGIFSSKGITGGSIGIIGVDTVHTTTMDRETGFRNVIGASGNFLLLPTQYMFGVPDASQRAAEAIIRDNEDLVGLFGANEGATEGVGNAIHQLGSSIIGVGFDQTDETVKLIREGSLNALMIQNPFTMGFLGMAEAYAALHGLDTGPNHIDTGISVMETER